MRKHDAEDRDGPAMDWSERVDPGWHSNHPRSLTAPSVLDATLPADLQAALGRALGTGPVETLGDWVAEVRTATGGGPIDVADLCHADDETAHWGEVGTDRYHFRCFYDAVILAALIDEPVDIRTERPGGEPVWARAAGTAALTVDPPDATFSFGIDDRVEPPDSGVPTPERVYAAVCPYVRAFPDLDAYGEWAPTVPATTVAMPLAGATDVAAALVE